MAEIAPFEVNPRLTQIAMVARPTGMIADMACPRANVGAKSFKYFKADVGQFYTIPDTRIGRTSRANQVEFGGELVPEVVEDYGLEDPVPVQDALAAQDQDENNVWDPVAEAITGVSILVSLDRERRVSDLVHSPTNYDANLQQTLAGASQWTHKDSDPLKAISDALDKPLIRPNAMVLGQGAWTALRRNPSIVESIRGTGAGAGAKGLVMRQEVAELFEIEKVLVGQAWYNAARRGQDQNFRRLWANHCALIKVDEQIPSTQSMQPVFCFTATWRSRMAGTYPDQSRGAHGAEVAKVVEHCKELVSFEPAGYLFRNAA